jgi:hypothetical protein
MNVVIRAIVPLRSVLDRKNSESTTTTFRKVVFYNRGDEVTLLLLDLFCSIEGLCSLSLVRVSLSCTLAELTEPHVSLD